MIIIIFISRGTRYMIFNHDLYRETKCMFPARCEGIEHFLSKIQLNTPDVEFILNTRDWPQIIKHYGDPKPVFSFSKVRELIFYYLLSGIITRSINYKN